MVRLIGMLSAKYSRNGKATQQQHLVSMWRKVESLRGFMAVVSHYDLGNILGLQRLEAAVTIQHNCCAKSAKLSSASIVVRLRTQKMMNKTVKQKNKMRSKFTKSGQRCIRIKTPSVEVDEMLDQKHKNHFTTYKQQMEHYINFRHLDIKALFRLYSTCISPTKQQVGIMVVNPVSILDQYVGYIHKMFGVIMDFQFGSYGCLWKVACWGSCCSRMWSSRPRSLRWGSSC